MSYLVHHLEISAFKDGMVHMSELIILLWFVTGNIGAVGHEQLLTRLFPVVYKLTVTKNELSLIQGVAIIQGA